MSPVVIYLIVWVIGLALIYKYFDFIGGRRHGLFLVGWAMWTVFVVVMAGLKLAHVP